MIVAKESGFGTIPLEHHRTQGRLNSRVAIAFEWTKRKQQFRKEGYTLNVSPGGCLAIVAHPFAIGSRLRLINLANQNSCEAVVVWICSDGPRNWQLGLELPESGFDFWGLEL